ncbi:hypothetical protein [Aquincola sp. J276]|uniref:hypothetical protein n=1 Tax=Aquincola sp. J276 TaxID=2898432 RepID=UPI002150D3C4|nr:hypothetical protein [Aquincola sp. J276]MCR5867815.1 DUF11 domain-containing protein [Aquincola sp. J276]
MSWIQFLRRALADVAALWLVGLLALCVGHEAGAAAPAGITIGNQATATYSDSGSVTRTVTSNTVLTTVQQVASVSLAANAAKTVSVGGQVVYAHTLVNTGNGPDSFNLAGVQSGSLAFASLQFFADANGDGVPDNATPITSTGTLTMGQAVHFVAVGSVPSSAVSGNVNALVITASSSLTPGAQAAVTDTTTVTGQAVLSVTQALDVTAGPSPSAGRIITITYSNTGNTAAGSLLLTEALPAGMQYVPGSARWSSTGATVLTDADAADNQSGIVYDFGATLGNRVTATIASVPAGATGTLSFRVDIAPGLPAGALPATAATVRYGYHDGAVLLPPAAANTVQYRVQAGAALTFSGSTVTAVPQGGVVQFTDLVTNTGNAVDSFDLATLSSNFPAGTTFQFFQPGGLTPLLDTNGNQSPDTGPLTPGASLAIVVRATLPPGASGGPYAMVAQATSGNDTAVKATATNTLQAVSSSGVDLSNNSAAPTAPGHGPGLEPAPVLLLPAAPGATVRFTLVAANGASVADSYQLQASTDPSFATRVLPAGWSVVFKRADGAVVDNTGMVASGGQATVHADVTLPSGALPGTTALYFRVVSPTTGAADRLHDAVVVGLQRGLALTPDHSGQATAGGTIVYSHMLVNTGGALEGDGVAGNVPLTVANSAPGFSAVLHWDRNNNGVLDPADPVVTDLSQLSGGSNGASTAAGLDAGESVRLLVKVTTPAGAAAGTANTTTVTAAAVGALAGVAAPAAAVATSATTVISSHVTLLKQQALDANCDGTPEGPYAVAPITAGAQPGMCLRYEVTATNAGPVAVTDLVLSDAVPAYTVYSATLAASGSSGTITAPADGSAGLVQVAVASLAPGQSVVLRFGVRILP